MQEFTDKLGDPDIQLEGLQIWIHGREFPEATDYWDGNWLLVTIHCGAKGADVWTGGPIIHLSEINRWVDVCEKMNNTLSGEADLECMEPEFSVKLRMETLGHILMEVTITPDHLSQNHTFKFEADQSYLSELIKACKQVLGKYPIKEEAE